MNQNSISKQLFLYLLSGCAKSIKCGSRDGGGGGVETHFLFKKVHSAPDPCTCKCSMHMFYKLHQWSKLCFWLIGVA